jgi:hypothetical protein
MQRWLIELVERAWKHVEWEEFSRLRLSEGGDLTKYYPLSEAAMEEYATWRNSQPPSAGGVAQC